MSKDVLTPRCSTMPFAKNVNPYKTMFFKKLARDKTCKALGPWVSNMYVMAADPVMTILKLAMLRVAISHTN